MGVILPLLGTLVSAGTSLIGGAMQAQAAEAAGRAQQQQFNYQAQIAEMNRGIAEENADRRRDVAALEAQQQDLATADILGQQLAIQGASGVALGSRSSLGARKGARIIGRRDALNLIQEGEIDAYNALTEAANFGAEAEASRLAGRNARAAGSANARAAMFSGASGAASSLIGGLSNFNTLGQRRSFAPVPRSRPTFRV